MLSAGGGNHDDYWQSICSLEQEGRLAESCTLRVVNAMLKNPYLFTSNEIMSRRPHYFIKFLHPASSLLEAESPFSHSRNPAQLGPQSVQLHPRRVAGEDGWLVDVYNFALQSLQPTAVDVIEATTPMLQFFLERETTQAIILQTGKEREKRPSRARQTFEEI